MGDVATVVAGGIKPGISEAGTGELLSLKLPWSIRSVSGQPGLFRETVKKMSE